MRYVYAVLGSLLLVFCSLTIVDAADSFAVVDCYKEQFTSVSEAHNDRNKNSMDKGDHLTWYFMGDENWKVDIKFVKKYGCYDVSPFDPNPAVFPHTIKHQGGHLSSKKSNAVRMNAQDGCYTYTITCTDAAGKEVAVIDPIIEVPKTSGLTKEEQTEQTEK